MNQDWVKFDHSQMSPEFSTVRWFSIGSLPAQAWAVIV